jgi:Co/Zn/Cd efflux system component
MNESPHADATQDVRRAVTTVALLNFAYFGVEFLVARRIGSVSLFADSIDFLEDAAVNLLILVGLAWSARQRAKLAMLLALVLLLPGVATVWTAWQQWQSAHVPAPEPLALTGLGALAVNLSCAFILAKVRHARGSLTRAAFLSARNDALANISIMVAAALTAWNRSLWPDLVVGVGIFLMNLDAAREILEAARDEHRATMEPRA